MIKACLSIKGSLVKPPLHHFVACTYAGKKEFKNWRKVDSYGYGQGKTMGHYLVQGMRIPTLPSQVPPSAWRTMVCLGLGNINVPPPLQVGGNVLSGDYYRVLVVPNILLRESNARRPRTPLTSLGTCCHHVSTSRSLEFHTLSLCSLP